MRSGRLTAILLAATIVMGASVPALRQAFTERLTQVWSPEAAGYPTLSRLTAVVAQAPEDPELRYACAVALFAELRSSGRTMGRETEPVSEEAVRDAFEQAARLAPTSAGPRLAWAIFEMDAAELTRLPGEPLTEGESHREPTAQQLEAAATARELLHQCRDLDPGNAAVDYLIAWTWLAEGRTKEALAAAVRGIRTDRWTVYDRQRVEALLALLDRTTLQGEFVPMAAIALNASQSHALGERLRSMARALRDLADNARARGNHEAAIRSYEAVLWAGHLMRVDAHNLIDGLLGVVLSAIAVSSDDWALADEEQRLAADPDIGKSSLRVHKFAAYLREHERGELAAFAEAEIEEAQRWKAQAREVVGRLTDELVRDVSGGPVLNAAAIWLTTAAALVLALLVGLLSLLARYWREPRAPSGWSYGQWLVLLALLVVPGQIGGLLTARQVVSADAAAGSLVSGTLGIAMLVGLVAWLVGILVFALKKRRAVPPEDRMSGPRSFLRAVRALVCPTLAALILLCMPATLTIEHNLERMAAKHRQLAIEGEVEHYGLRAEATASGRERPGSGSSTDPSDASDPREG